MQVFLFLSLGNVYMRRKGDSGSRVANCRVVGIKSILSNRGIISPYNPH